MQTFLMEKDEVETSSDDEASTSSDEESQTSSLEDDHYMICVPDYDTSDQSSNDTADHVVDPEIEDIPPDTETFRQLDADAQPGPHNLRGPRPVHRRATVISKLPLNSKGRLICPYCEKDYKPNSLGKHLVYKHHEVRRAVSRYRFVKTFREYLSVKRLHSETGDFGKYGITTEGYKYLRSRLQKSVGRTATSDQLRRAAVSQRILPLWALSINENCEEKLRRVIADRTVIAQMHGINRAMSSRSNTTAERGRSMTEDPDTAVIEDPNPARTADNAALYTEWMKQQVSIADSVLYREWLKQVSDGMVKIPNPDTEA